MSEAFIGEIRMFGGNFAPSNWAFCDGQLIEINLNPELFSVLGNMYGGDGRTTFALPDLRGRLPVHAGQGPGLTGRTQGRSGGAETVTLSLGEMAGHNHPVFAANIPSTGRRPIDCVLAQSVGAYYAPGEPVALMSPEGMTDTGGGQPHDNVMPFLCVNFIIALSGMFPSRT